MSSCPGCEREVLPQWKNCPECGSGLERERSSAGGAGADDSFSYRQTMAPPSPTAHEPTPASEPGARLGPDLARRFEDRGELGAGGMGFVRKAYDVRADRLVAIKRMRLAHREDLRDRFDVEARALAKLHHPNIVPLHEVGEDEAGAYLIMKYVEGESLAQVMARRRRDKQGGLPLEQVRHLLGGIAAGLHHAHSKGILHRDVKPGNVIVSAEDGEPVLVDLGLAQESEGIGLTRTGDGMGSYGYTAPEVMKDARSARPSADVYSLGCLAYELITAHAPPVHTATLPVGWRNLLSSSTDPKPELRPQTIEEFWQRAQSAFRGVSAAVERPPRPARKGRLVLAVLAVVLLLVGLKLFSQGGTAITEPGVATEAADATHPNLQLIGRNAKGYREYALRKDPSVILIRIPGGVFDMGSTAETAEANEGPITRVRLEGYFIGKTEVTQAQYRRFCEATGHEQPPAPEWGTADDHPVVLVTWEDARAYCEWAGLSLPSEAEWEFAARGSEAGRTFPWGPESSFQGPLRANLGGDEDGHEHTAPVASFPAGTGPFGTLDQAGNVWEWVQDHLAPYPGGFADGHRGPSSGTHRVIRGGSWFNSVGTLRSTARNGVMPRGLNQTLGFRVAAR